jgi:hypothetical protein
MKSLDFMGYHTSTANAQDGRDIAVAIHNISAPSLSRWHNMDRWKGYSVLGRGRLPEYAMNRLIQTFFSSSTAQPSTSDRYLRFSPLGGRLATVVPPNETSFGNRDALFMMVSNTLWHADTPADVVQDLWIKIHNEHTQFRKDMGGAYQGSYAGYNERTPYRYNDLVQNYGSTVHADRILDTKVFRDPLNIFQLYLPNQEEERWRTKNQFLLSPSTQH